MKRILRRASTCLLWREAKAGSYLQTAALSLLKGRLHLRATSAPTRIAILDGVARQGLQPSPNRFQRGVVRKEQVNDGFQVVYLRHGEAEVLQQRFEVFLGRLLAMEPHCVTLGFGVCGQTSCDLDVLLGFEDPLGGLALHPKHFPFPRSREGTNRSRLPSDRFSCARVYGQLGPTRTAARTHNRFGSIDRSHYGTA